MADHATCITPLQLWNNASGEMADFENNSEIMSGGAIGLPVNCYSLQDSLALFFAVEFHSFCNVWDPINSRNLCIAATGSNFEKNNFKSWSFSSSCLQIDGRKIDGRNKRVNRIVLVVAYSFGLCHLVTAVATGFYFSLWLKERRVNTEEDPDFDARMDDEFKRVIGPKRCPYDELVCVTNFFSKEEKLGEGGVGVVYRGVLHKE